MKNTFLLSLILLSYACQSEQQETTKVVESNEITKPIIQETENNAHVEAEFKACSNDLMIVENTDPFSCKDYGDSIVYVYDNFTVKTAHHP